MPAIKQVSFTTPYSAEEAEIMQRRKLAELLQARGQEPLGDTQVVGGWAIPRSPMEGVGKMAQQISGAYQQKQATEMAKALGERQRGDRSSDMTTLAAMLRGAPASSENIIDEQAAGGEGAPATINAPARPGGIDPAMLGQLRSPEMQQMGMQMWGQQMQRENSPPTRVDLGDKIGLVNPQGQIVGYLSKGATPDATLREGGAQQRHLTPSGGNLLSAQTALQNHLTPSGSAQLGAQTTMRGQNMTDARYQQTLAQGKTPPGYRATAEGNLQAIPGGPADTKLPRLFNPDTLLFTN